MAYPSFTVRVDGRSVRITLDGLLADVYDIVTGRESQAILRAASVGVSGRHELARKVVSDYQVQDAIRSVHFNATGTALPAVFEITFSTTDVITAPDPDTRGEQ